MTPGDVRDAMGFPKRRRLYHVGTLYKGGWKYKTFKCECCGNVFMRKERR